MPLCLCLSPIVHKRPCAMKTCLFAIALRPQLLCNPRLHIFRHALTLHTLHAFTHALTWSHITCIKTYTRMTAYYIKHTHTRTHTHIHVLASHAHALTWLYIACFDPSLALPMMPLINLWDLTLRFVCGLVDNMQALRKTVCMPSLITSSISTLSHSRPSMYTRIHATHRTCPIAHLSTPALPQIFH